MQLIWNIGILFANVFIIFFLQITYKLMVFILLLNMVLLCWFQFQLLCRHLQSDVKSHRKSLSLPWLLMCHTKCRKFVKTRITTFIKAKLKKLDDQSNIDKFRVAANIAEYHIISKLIFLGIITPKFRW